MSTQTFHALTAAEWLQVTQELTFSEVRVLYYLQALCPYGDNDLELNLGTEAEKLGIGRSTLAAALHSLSQQQYVEIVQARPSYKVRPKLVSPIAAKKAKQQLAESQSTAPERSPAEQTTCQQPVISSGGPDAGIDLDREREKTNKTPILSYSGAGEKKPQVVIRSRRPAERSQQPDGPWLLPDRKYDPAFIEAVARNWVTRWGGELSDRTADVLSHFRKDPANIAIQWRWYAEAYRERFEKARDQLAAGGSLDEEYQQRLAASARALTAELPAELNPVSPGIAGVRITTPAIPTAAEPAAPPEAWAAARLQLFNDWLHHPNPTIREKAIAEAENNPNYQLETDAEGQPIRIVEVTQS